MFYSNPQCSTVPLSFTHQSFSFMLFQHGEPTMNSLLATEKNTSSWLTLNMNKERGKHAADVNEQTCHYRTQRWGRGSVMLLLTASSGAFPAEKVGQTSSSTVKRLKWNSSQEPHCWQPAQSQKTCHRCYGKQVVTSTFTSTSLDRN